MSSQHATRKGTLQKCPILTNVIKTNDYFCFKLLYPQFNRNTYFSFIDYAKAFDCVDHNKLRKILQETGIPDHFTCLLRNLYAGQEETVRTGHQTTDWFQIGKGRHQGCILSLLIYLICRVHHVKCQAG